jgi:hypothetical protein
MDKLLLRLKNFINDSQFGLLSAETGIRGTGSILQFIQPQILVTFYLLVILNIDIIRNSGI